MGHLAAAKAMPAVAAVVEATHPAFHRLAAVQAVAADPYLVALAADRAVADPRAASWVYPRLKACHPRPRTVAFLESVVSVREVSG